MKKNIFLGGIFSASIHIALDYLGPISEILAGLIPALIFAEKISEAIIIAVIGSLIGDTLAGLIILFLFKSVIPFLNIPEIIQNLSYLFIIIWITQGMIISLVGSIIGYKIRAGVRNLLKNDAIISVIKT